MLITVYLYHQSNGMTIKVDYICPDCLLTLKANRVFT